MDFIDFEIILWNGLKSQIQQIRRGFFGGENTHI